MGPDGFIYADGSGRTSLLRVEAKPGAVPRWFTALDTASGEVDHTWPDVVPNGNGVPFTVSFDRRNGVKGALSYADILARALHGALLDRGVFLLHVRATIRRGVR